MSTWTQTQKEDKAREIAEWRIESTNYSDVYEDEELEELADGELNQEIYNLIMNYVRVTL